MAKLVLGAILFNRDKDSKMYMNILRLWRPSLPDKDRNLMLSQTHIYQTQSTLSSLQPSTVVRVSHSHMIASDFWICICMILCIGWIDTSINVQMANKRDDERITRG